MAAEPEGALLGRWYAGLGEYDYLQYAEFHPGGVGELLLGYGQAVKYQARFRYAVAGAGRLRVTLSVAEEGEPGPERELGFEVADGPFPVAGGGRVARRRLRFAADPFPEPWPGGKLPLDYYQW